MLEKQNEKFGWLIWHLPLWAFSCPRWQMSHKPSEFLVSIWLFPVDIWTLTQNNQPLHFGLLNLRNLLLFILFFRNAQQNKREIRMAYVTFAIVGIFLSFNLPRIVVAGYEVSQTWLILHCVQNGSEYMPVLPFYYWDSISRLFMVINSSLNFLVYCTGSDQFKVSLNLPRGIYKLRSTFTKEMA